MARNPYQLDPFLAQGFSNLTKALIGDPETDFQVARTNRVNELLPLEKQQMQSNIAGNNASAAASNALATLRAAQTLSEEELREPTTQLKIAEAKKVLADVAKVNAQTQTINDLRSSQIESERYLGQSRLADSMLDEAKRATVNALRVPQVNSEDALTTQRNAAAVADTSRGGLYDAQADTEKQLLPGKLDQQGADAAKTFAEISKTNRQTNEVQSNIDLNEAKIEAQNRIILNEGQTVRFKDKQGNDKTYTAPQQVEITLEPGEEATVLMGDGSTKKFSHSEKAIPDPSNAKTRLDLISEQMTVFNEDGFFANVPKGVMRRLQSNFTSAAKDKDIESVVRGMQAQLSQTYEGQQAVTIDPSGFRNEFDAPAFIINFLMAARQNNSLPASSALSKKYGFSKEQSEAILAFVKAQP
jgi:hypothetical protein